MAKDQRSNAPVILLHEPQMGENIGAAARAMANFGLQDLRLIAPRDGWPSETAIQNASGALDGPVTVQVFETLTEAMADLHFVFATTARPRDMVKPVYTPRAAIQETSTRSASGQRTGFLFGRERTGLENDQLSLCQAIVTADTNPDFSSLNLGQSVLMIAYEWLCDAGNADPRLSYGDSFPARNEDLQVFLTRLEEELESGGFFRSSDLKPTMVRNIANIFARANLSDQELRTLHGILSALIGKKKPPSDEKAAPEKDIF